MRDKFFSLAESIDKDPGLAKIKNIIKEGDVISQFPKVFPDLVKIATAIKIEKGVLFLRVENSVWRNELRLKEAVLVEKVNKFFKEIRIYKVKFIP